MGKFTSVAMRGIALLLVAAPAAAEGTVEFPARKSGYWEIRMVHVEPAGAPDMLIHACIDTASDRQMMASGLSMTKDMCSKTDMKREGDAIVIDADCKMGPMKTTSHTVMSGDFQSSYTVKVTGTVDGMPAIAGGAKGPMKTSMTQNAKWLAEKCPEGVKPGDMQMPGGMKININEMFDKKSPAEAQPQPGAKK